MLRYIGDYIIVLLEKACYEIVKNLIMIHKCYIDCGKTFT